MIKKYKVGVKSVSEVSIPSEFKSKDKPNMALLSQAWRVYFDSSHAGSHKTKTRSEINRTTKKWFRQKGTGNARHGARSAPIFVGGGTAHGPKGVKRALSLPKKMTQKALRNAVLLKINEEKVVLVEGLEKIKKTKEANELLKNISAKGNLSLVLSKKNKDVRRFLRNIERVNIINNQNLNAMDVMGSNIVIFDNEIFTEDKKPRTSAKHGTERGGKE
jgi:large subunit ribosomal protein L4